MKSVRDDFSNSKERNMWGPYVIELDPELSQEAVSSIKNMLNDTMRKVGMDTEIRQDTSQKDVYGLNQLEIHIANLKVMPENTKIVSNPNDTGIANITTNDIRQSRGDQALFQQKIKECCEYVDRQISSTIAFKSDPHQNMMFEGNAGPSSEP